MRAFTIKGIFLAGLIIFANLFCCVPQSFPQDLDQHWEELIDLKLTSTSGKNEYPSLDFDKMGNIHIAWANENCRILYTKLDGGGNILKENFKINTSWHAQRPCLRTDNSGNVHIVWMNFPPENGELYYCKLDEAGNKLVKEKRVTFSKDYAKNPRMDIDSLGNLHIIWIDARSEEGMPYYIKLDNNGEKLLDAVKLDDSNTNKYSLNIDKSNNVNILWQNAAGKSQSPGIYYLKLDNSGNKIQEKKHLSQPLGILSNSSIDGSNFIHLTCLSGNNLYYNKLDANGEPLLSNIKINSNKEYDLNNATWSFPSSDIGIDKEGNVHIAWMEKDNKVSGFYYAKLNNSGEAIIGETYLDRGDKSVPCLNADSAGNIHITWQYNKTDTKTSQIHYAKGKCAMGAALSKAKATGNINSASFNFGQ